MALKSRDHDGNHHALVGHDNPNGRPAHSHAEGHFHDHGHSHGAPISDERRIAWAFVIILSFMFVEVAGGLISGSLALLADAGHMVSDAAALGISWIAIRIARRPADEARSMVTRGSKSSLPSPTAAR